MNVRLVVAELLAFSAIVGVHAAEPETIGLWVFDGTPGAAVAADQVTIPNAIPGKAPVLTLDVHKAEVPRPTYSDQKMGAYLFNGKDYKSYITNLTGSIRLQKRYGQNTLSWTDRHAYIAVSNALELAGSDFTVEFIYRIGSQPPNPWPGWTYFYNLPDVNSWHINGFNTVRDQTTNVILNDNNTSAGIADNDWHHFAAVWTESDKTAQVYFDYSATGVVPMTKTAYAITNAAQMVARIFYGGGSMYYFGDAYVQAVRLTKGALTCDDFMAVKNEPQTGAFSAYHWTFDNTADGTPFKYCPMEGTGRLDYKLFKQTARTSAQTITGSVDVIKACVKDKTSGLRENKASIFTHDNVTAEGNGHLGLSLYRDLTMTSNFTWEAFVKLPTNALVGANGGQFFSTEIPKAYVTEQYNSKGFYVCQNSKISTNHWDSTIRGKAHIIFCVTCWTNTAHTGVGNNDQRFEFGVDLDKWTHLAFTYDAATRTFTAYKNYQVAKNSYQTCRTVFSEDKAPAFNYDADGNFVMRLFNAALNRNSGFEGSLDELRISTRVLTPDEFLKPRTGLGLSVIVR